MPAPPRVRWIRRRNVAGTWSGRAVCTAPVGLRGWTGGLAKELRPEMITLTTGSEATRIRSFRRELVLLSRRAHDCASVFRIFRAVDWLASLPFLRNRVVTKIARERRRAAAASVRAKPASHPKPFNRLVGIARTRRFEAATPSDKIDKYAL